MAMIDNKPLVSVCFTCYNRRRFVSEAFKSVLEQTYSPLEIVVSDNCSTDGTKEIVLDLIKEYQKGNGPHKIVFNSNESNIGLVRNIEKCYSMAHGELIVPAHDDDVSYPTRVAVLVKAWCDDDKRPLALLHSVMKIDSKGRECGEIANRTWKDPLGAANAYSKELFVKFGQKLPQDCYEDTIYVGVAAFLGGIKVVDEKLLKYRIGCGSSTSGGSLRKISIKNNQDICRATDHLLEYLNGMREYVNGSEYPKLQQNILSYKHESEMKLELMAGKTFKIRYGTFLKIRACFPTPLFFIQVIFVLFPGKFGDLLLDMYSNLNGLRHRFTGK